MKTKLHLVDQAEQPADVTQLLHRDIEARDWSRVHIAADRRGPVSLPERLKRIWRG